MTIYSTITLMLARLLNLASRGLELGQEFTLVSRTRDVTPPPPAGAFATVVEVDGSKRVARITKIGSFMRCDINYIM
jgi:hypothetical protein